MSHIFISYDRVDKIFTDRIADALVNNSLDVWTDLRNLQAGIDFKKQITDAIIKADALLFLFSANSVKAPGCQEEINQAVEHNKRIIVVRIDDQVDENNLPPPISPSDHYLDYREEKDDFDAVIRKILTAIKKDYDWNQDHTKLEVKAVDWERYKDNSRLLRGKELREAEEKLIAAGSQSDPIPTDLQRRFVSESRRTEQNRRRITIGISSGVTITICILCVIAFVLQNIATQNANARTTAQANELAAQANELAAQATTTAEVITRVTAQANAGEKARIARSREFAEKVTELRDSNPVLSLLLSVEAFRLDDNDQTRSLLFESTLAYPHIKQFVSGIGGGNGIAFSPDGKTFVRGYGEGILLYDTTSWQRTSALTYPIENSSITHVAFHPDGKKIATGSHGGAVLLWDVASGQPFHTLAEHNQWEDNLYIENLSFNLNGQLLVSSRNDGTINVWDVRVDPPELIFNRKFSCAPDIELGPGRRNSIDHGVAISPDSKILAVCDDTHYFSLWDITTGNKIGAPVGRPAGQLSGILFSPDGRNLISFGDNNISFWDVSTGEAIRTSTGEGDGIYSLAISPDGNTLAYSSKDTQIFIWDVAEEKLLDTFALNDSYTARAEDLTFSPDGNTLAARFGGLLITIWDIAGNQSIVKTFDKHETVVKNVDFSPNDKDLVSISEDGTAITWKVDTGEILSMESGHETYDTFGTGIHGNILVTQRSTGKVELWDENDKLIGGQPLIGHTGYINTILFSPDEKMLATSGDDQTIKLWDIYSSRLIVTLTGHTGRVFGLAFSSDGKKLASASADGTVRIWNIDSWSWIEEVCQRAGRNIEMPKDTSDFDPSDFENYVPNDEWSENFPGEEYHITCPQWPPGN